MKIISFSHYTCGGLLCDILNGTFSDVDANGGINDSIKAKSTLSNDEPNATVADESGKITAEVQSNKLKQLLGQIKQA